LIQSQHVSREFNEAQAEMHRAQHAAPTGGSEHSLQEMRALRTRLTNSHKTMIEHMHRAMALRRESLVIGFKFLDANNSGSIEASDMPNLSTEIFSRLDRRNKHVISPKDLLKGVDGMEKNVETFNTRITDSLKEINKMEDDRQNLVAEHSHDANPEKWHMKSEEIAVAITKKQADMWSIIAERDREEAMLKETYTVFQQGFVDSLFTKLGSCCLRPHDKRKYYELNRDLAGVEKKIPIGGDVGTIGSTTVPMTRHEEFGDKVGVGRVKSTDHGVDNEFTAMENLQRRLHAL